MFEEDNLKAEVVCRCCRRRHHRLSLRPLTSTTCAAATSKRKLFITKQEEEEEEEEKPILPRQLTRESHIMQKCHHHSIHCGLNQSKQFKTVIHNSNNNNNSTIAAINSSSMTLLIVMALALTITWPQAGFGQQAAASTPTPDQIRAAILPTVIVRGFLNYRTTVDGTVLLFTPDAGGISSVSTSAAVAPTAAATSLSSSMIQVTSSRAVDQIEPTGSLQAPMATAVAEHQMPTMESASEPWSPVQATPALQPAQTAMKSAQPETPQSPMAASASSGVWQEPAGRHQSQNNESQSPTETSPRRTETGSQVVAVVEAEDVGAQAASSTTTTTTTTRAPVVDSAPARTSRPRRPSLGFNGQAIRAGGQRSDRARAQTGNQNEAQTFNTINGIRRPGISTTPGPATDAQQQAPAQPSRSSIAGAKLRNRFKRPPISGAAVISTPAPPTTPANNPIVLLQSAESGEEPSVVVGAPVADWAPVPSVQEIVATSSEAAVIASAGKEQQVAAEQKPSGGAESELESRMGDQAALQARLGDLFGPSPPPPPLQQPQAAVAAGSAMPAVGSDEVLLASAGAAPFAAGDTGLDPRKLVSRSGDQPPSQHESLVLAGGGLSGELQQGQLGSSPLSFDAFFQSDQPQQSESSDHRAHHQAKESAISGGGSGGGGAGSGSKKSHNDRLTGWLDHQNKNKHIPRPLKHHAVDKDHHEPGHLSQQLAANLNSLSPSFISNIPSSLKPTPVQQQTAPIHQLSSAAAPESSGAAGVAAADQQMEAAQTNASLVANGNATTTDRPEVAPLQTLTRTYSTMMTSTRTRLVPLNVKSSTAVYTITENYVITKMLTAYQTMPAMGEFILPEAQSTRSPFEMFNETPVAPDADSTKSSARLEQPIAAPSNFIAPPIAQPEEQPISLDGATKSANDWLHDFNNLNNMNLGGGSSNNNNQLSQQQQSLQQNQHLAALLEQQAQENNLAGFAAGLGEPLDQLASSLDPAALLNSGQIQIPDLNNPIVLAAAIQNPQLAAIILAAQQLQLKQRGINKLAAANSQQQAGQQQLQQQMAPVQQLQLQPSYSTTYSVQVRPSTYTVRDTMFTTRLVSFKDGRTVRTRTVSEPGSVIEQVLTTTVTETLPVTLTIRPTGTFTLPAAGLLATAAPPSPANQATLNNALIATQLASLLSRRQQQVQPSGLAALQQLLAGNQQAAALQRAASNNQQQQQFQPSFQNLLQSLQQQQQQLQANPSPFSSSPQPPSQQQQQASPNRQQVAPAAPSQQQQQQLSAADAADKMPQQQQPTPPLPTQPFVTTLTSLQVRTYTVHNAFKTIYRTITSTQLITSTIFPAGMTRSPTLMG